MMFLFRSTFITAISAFAVALCLFSMSASAVPQFGRPMLHALDAVTTLSGTEAVPTSTATNTGTDPDPDPQVVEATSSTFTSTSASSTAVTTPTASSTSTNGASSSLRGGMGVMLGVAVSGVWLAF